MDKILFVLGVVTLMLFASQAGDGAAKVFRDDCDKREVVVGVNMETGEPIYGIPPMIHVWGNGCNGEVRTN